MQCLFEDQDEINQNGGSHLQIQKQIVIKILDMRILAYLELKMICFILTPA